jgi:hypothetical protein
MTAAERVKRTQRVLAAVAIGEALAWGFAATLVLLTIVPFLAPPASRLPLTVSRLPLSAAIVAGLLIAFSILWKSRHITSASRVALWIEERVPALHYSLVTAAEQPDSPASPALEELVARENLGRVTLVSIRKGVLLAAAALVAGLLLLYVAQSAGFGRAGASTAFGGLARPGAITVASRLESLDVRITPPAYTGARATTLDDPSSIDALVGSTITIRGKGPAAGITASLSAPLRVAEAGGNWVVSLAMPAKPAALELEDRNYDRAIVLAPRIDAPPRIVLTAPIRDTTLRKPHLTVQLDATAGDDIGLGDSYFEYLVTSGSGEIFTSRVIIGPLVQFRGARTGALHATLDIATLKLGEGDVLSMRAITRDGNTVTGPGIASSDTRTIRIARAGEYDSLAIEAAAPPPIDSSAMSQRMLIVMTEQLVRELPRLTRQELVKRSTDIGDMEERIRRRVHEIISETSEETVETKAGDSAATVEEMEAPEEVTGTKNPDLVRAYNSLWQAVRSLQIAEPAPALPPMRVALQALDKARLANRLYLRGAPPKIVVDLQRVRLTGKEKGVSSTRTPRSFADSARVALLSRFDAMLDLIEKQPAKAMTDLALLRVDALQALPDFAAALGDATDAIRAGRDATVALLRARRALEGPARVTPGLPAWSGA